MKQDNNIRIIQRFALADEILTDYQRLMGIDYEPYRNHVIRMLNFTCVLASPDEHELELLQIAAAFHDIGIWTAHTVDYLPPSLAEADKWLSASNMARDRQVVMDMIEWHHKVSAIKDNASRLPEFFRRGDLVDFSLGFVTAGLPKAFIQEVRNTFPNAGFHKMLMKLSLKRLLSHPLDPAPMVRK